MSIAKIPFVLFALIFSALASPALAQDGAKSAATATEAAQAFRAYLDSAAAKSERPDLSKPEVAAMLGRIYDLKALGALPPVRANDLPWLIAWMTAANGTNKLLLTYGGKPGSQPDLNAIERNLADYGDQVAADANFLVRGQSREAASMKLFMAALAPEQRTPLREQSFAGFSNSMAETLIKIIGGVVVSGKPANARLVSGALRDTGADWATSLLSADRERLLAQLPALTAKVQDNTARSDLAAFTAAIKEGK